MGVGRRVRFTGGYRHECFQAAHVGILVNVMMDWRLRSLVGMIGVGLRVPWCIDLLSYGNRRPGVVRFNIAVAMHDRGIVIDG